MLQKKRSRYALPSGSSPMQPAPPSERSKITAGYKFWLLFSLLLILACCLRLYRLEWQSLTDDEQFSLVTCSEALGHLNRALVSDFVHPPLHSYLLHYWMAILGYGTASARMLSVIAGIAAVAATYVLAKCLFDLSTGLMAAFLMAISQVGVYYSQLARDYALAIFLTAVCIALWVRAVETKSAREWWMFTVASILLLYTHYYSVTVFGALVIWAILYRKSNPVPIRRWITSAAIVVLAFLPWLASGVIKAAERHGTKLVSGNPLAAVHWYSPVSTLNWFNNGKWDGFDVRAPLWAYAAGAILFLLPVLLTVVPRLKRGAPEPKVVLLALLSLLPILVPIVAGAFFGIQYQVRYTIFALVPYYIWVAYGITLLKPTWLRVCLIGGISLCSARALWADYFVPITPDYQTATRYVVQHYRPGDCIVFTPGERILPPIYWKAYYPQGPAVRPIALDDALAPSNTCARVWLLWDGIWWKNPPSATADRERTMNLLSTRLQPVTDRDFFEFWVRLYERRIPSKTLHQSHMGLP